MKNLGNFIAYVAIIMMSVVMSISLVSCSESYSDEDRITPPTPTTPKDTTPDPEPDNTWRWNTIVDQTISFDPATEWVDANNIAQLTNSLGETKLDSATLRYQFGVEVSAPTRIVTTSQDTTVYTGKGIQKSEYSNFERQGNDSLRTVTTVVEGGFRTSYYTLGLTTSRKEGFSLHAGKWLAYKNVTESSVMSSVWHEAIHEVEVNDSIFNRETVHNVLTITLKSERQSWTIQREKVVIVDHLIKIKGEKEEVKADYWVNGLGRMVSLTIGIREDTHMPAVYAHFEGEKGHTIFVYNYNTAGTFQGIEQHFVSYEVAEKSNDYDGVGYIKGKFYPGKITYTKVGDDGKCGWVITCRAKGIEDGVPQQSIDGSYANTRGLKNFYKGNTAYPSPYMVNTSTSKEVNGKKVWYINGHTSEKRAIPEKIIADSSLK